MKSTQNTEFYTKTGFLTDYGLSCGYVEGHDKCGIATQLWKEHNSYHVRQYDRDKHIQIFWDTFDILTEARKRYTKTTNK